MLLLGFVIVVIGNCDVLGGLIVPHDAAETARKCGAVLGRGKLIAIDRAQGVRCLKCAGPGWSSFLRQTSSSPAAP